MALNPYLPAQKVVQVAPKQKVKKKTRKVVKAATTPFPPRY